MKIPVHYSLKVARNVVSKIDLPKEIARGCWVESWSNGREQGLYISRLTIPSNSGKKIVSQGIVIAQQRSSDDILVVCGDAQYFDVQTHQPSDKLWEKEGARFHFHYKDVEKAAKHIEKFLKNP